MDQPRSYVDSDGTRLKVVYNSDSSKPERTRLYSLDNGREHRLDGPSYEEWHPGGQIASQHWRVDGLLHHVGGPAEEDWLSNGQLAARRWMVRGITHRTNGPAEELWHENGNLARREWWIDGKKHRLDGPAAERWHENGQLTWQEWWVNGYGVSDAETLRAVIDPATPPKRLALLARSSHPGIAALAANSPACPEEAKTWWALTQSGQ